MKKLVHIYNILLALSWNIYGCDSDKECICVETENPVIEKCRYHEQYDQKRNLCWDRCLLGERWTGKDCEAVNHRVLRLNYDSALVTCNSIGARLPTLEEFESLLGDCFPTGDLRGRRRCRKCRESKECQDFFSPLDSNYNSRPLWASDVEPRKIYLFWGQIEPMRNSSQPEENEVYAICVRDIHETK